MRNNPLNVIALTPELSAGLFSIRLLSPHQTWPATGYGLVSQAIRRLTPDFNTGRLKLEERRDYQL
jgi:hypothetical protein